MSVQNKKNVKLIHLLVAIIIIIKKKMIIIIIIIIIVVQVLYCSLIWIDNSEYIVTLY